MSFITFTFQSPVVITVVAIRLLVFTDLTHTPGTETEIAGDLRELIALSEAACSLTQLLKMAHVLMLEDQHSLRCCLSSHMLGQTQPMPVTVCSSSYRWVLHVSALEINQN